MKTYKNNKGFNHIHCVPRKGFGSDICETIFIFFLSLCAQTADPNPFLDTHCIIYIKERLISQKTSIGLISYYNSVCSAWYADEGEEAPADERRR